MFSAFFLQGPKNVTETLGDFVRYGYVGLPLWVFAEQLGVPIPAAPILLAAGAIASTGRMNLLFLTALALAGALATDLIWYRAGYSHGSRALGRLCRVCLGARFLRPEKEWLVARLSGFPFRTER